MKYLGYSLALFLTCGSTVLAQTTNPAPTTAPADMPTLLAENAQLRAEVATLKEQLAAAKTATTKPALEVIKTFRTMQDVLEKTPADLRPTPQPDWTKYTFSKYAAWVEAQLVGMRFDAKLPFNGCTVLANSTRRPESAWQIYSGAYGYQHFKWFGTDNTWGVAFQSRYVDEATARKWESTKKGTLVQIKGIIRSVKVSRIYYTDSNKMPQLHYSLELRDMEVIFPK